MRPSSSRFDEIKMTESGIVCVAVCRRRERRKTKTTKSSIFVRSGASGRRRHARPTVSASIRVNAHCGHYPHMQQRAPAELPMNIGAVSGWMVLDSARHGPRRLPLDARPAIARVDIFCSAWTSFNGGP